MGKFLSAPLIFSLPYAYVCMLRPDSTTADIQNKHIKKLLVNIIDFIYVIYILFVAKQQQCYLNK